MAVLKLFYSYANADESLRDRLEKHLAVLRREEMIAEWYDRKIMPGEVWADEIDTHLETASIILLLVSPDFLASDSCYENEMLRALERHRRGEARVIPIILRPCDWQHSPLKGLQCLPRGGQPVTEWDNPDLAFLDVVKELRRVIEQQARPFVLLSPINRQNRMRMLKQVHRIWIDGLLTQSLHYAARIELHLQDRPDMLTNPLQLRVQELDQTPKNLPKGTTIAQVYDKAEGELLILGEPGAGKTTLLLELTSTLLERAEQDERLPMPIVFNLSSWAEKRLSLRTWLEEELSTIYHVPRKMGKAWIDADQVLPLLDGLDEVANEARIACVELINDYYQSRLEHGSSPIVVCCRSEEYAALSTRVMFQHAINILPLTDAQINTYLERGGEQVKALKQALDEDVELRSLACQPLMLNIFIFAYQGATIGEVSTGRSHEEVRHTIFARYVEHMLKRRGQSKHWQPEQVILWLTFLAKRMQQRDQTVLSVENLQPIWLSRKLRLLYEASLGLFRGLIFGLFGALMQGLLGVLIRGLTIEVVVAGLVTGLAVGPLAGPVADLVRRLIMGLGIGIHPAEAFTWSWKRALSGSVAGLVTGLAAGLVAGLFRGLVAGLGAGLLEGLAAGLAFGLFFGLVLGLAEGLIGGLVGELIKLFDTDIHPTEALTWSWKRALRGLFFGLVAGLVVGLVAGLVADLVGGLLLAGPVVLVEGMVAGLVFALTFGLSRKRLPEDLSLSANEGIWRSGTNGLRGGLLTGLALGLVVGLLVGLVKGLLLGLIFGLVAGLVLGLLAGLAVGLEAFVKHFLLRFFLLQRGNFPRKLVAFLDEVAERLLLRKVGGSYIFVHRQLLDYFAELEEKDDSSM